MFCGKYLLSFLLASILTGSAVATELPKLAFAHYTAWHHPFNASETAGRYYNFPEFHSSGRMAEDYRREIKAAMAQGIDGFFVDMVGNNNEETHYVANMNELLKAAEGTPFLVGPCLDRAYSDLDWQVSELKKIFDTCGRHPNYPKVDGKYVVTTYSCTQRTPAQWRYIREKLRAAGYEVFLIANMFHAFSKLKAADVEPYAKEFEMLHSFGEYGISGQSIQECFDILSNTARANGKGWMPPIHPGYLGAWFNGRNDYYQPYRGFDQVLDSFAAIRPGTADWLHFTTWNDFDETPFAPTVFEFGTYTEINRIFVDRWKGKPFLSESPKLFFAYHREELVGTVWRLEALTAPTVDGKPMQVGGRLIGIDGKTLAEIPVRQLSTRDFDRAEWQIPTAALAVSPAFVPVIEWRSGNRTQTSRLPAVFLKSGWLQNQVTVKAPAHRMSDLSPELKISQDGNRLDAELTLDSPEAISHATLWRNDRPIGEFRAVSPGRLLFVDFQNRKPITMTAKLDGAAWTEAGRKFHEPGPNFNYTADTLKTVKNSPTTVMRAALAAKPEAAITVKINREPPRRLTVAELLQRHTVSLDKDGVVQIRQADYDTAIMNRPELDRKNGTFKLELYSRPPLTDDIFYVRLTTRSGRIIFSNPIAPFAAGKPLHLVDVIETGVNLETSTGMTGRPNRTGLLNPPLLAADRMVRVPVHPACFRSGRWTFENEGWDDLGERPFQTAKSLEWKERNLIKAPGENGGKALALNDKTAIAFRARSYPIGACTIEFSLNPDTLPGKNQPIITRTGWQEAFNFTLLADGRIEVIRNGGKESVEARIISRTAIPVGKWTRLRLTFDERKIKLYVDGKLDGETAVPFNRRYGNCIAQIGPFRGMIDNITFLSRPVPPEDPDFPALPR